MRWAVRTFKMIGLGWVAWRLFGPDLEPVYNGVQERPVHLPGRTVFVGHREFFVREAGPGDGEVLVLVHGWSFDGEMTYYRLIPALADRYRVVVPDQRNHGKSDRIRGSFEIEDLATELAGVLDALGITRPVHLFGYSMGGMVAQVFARRHPERLRSLTLAATAAYPIAHRRMAARASFWLARAAARFSKREAASFTFQFLTRSGILDERLRRWMWGALLNRDPTLYYESGSAVWRFDSRRWIGSLSLPTMVIIPDNDRVVPVEAQRELASLLPDPTVVDVPRAGHESILSQPDDYLAVIARFVDGIT